MIKNKKLLSVVIMATVLLNNGITVYGAEETDGVGFSVESLLTTRSEDVSNELTDITEIAESIAVMNNDLIQQMPSFEGVILQYSKPYEISEEKLTSKKGVYYFNNHKETYYSQKVLAGGGLNIPGRHVAEDGTIRDEDGYLCVAADFGFMTRGSCLMTSLGPAKVYDTGCQYGVIDIYVNW